MNQRLWKYFWLIASVWAIAIVTVSPVHFVVPEYLSPQVIFEKFSRVSSVKDYWRNILLFIPFGFSLAGTLRLHKLRYWLIFCLSLIASVGLSFTVEIAQFFIPSRISNFTDVATNTLGGILGTAIYRWRREIIALIGGIISRHKSRLKVKSLVVGLLVYGLSIAFAVATLAINVNLANWETDYPLIIGNEASANRPWQGYIKALQIDDRPLTTAEIEQSFGDNSTWLSPFPTTMATLVFISEDDYYLDLARDLSSNYLPGLIWQGNAAPERNFLLQSLSETAVLEQVNSGAGVLINGDRWLQTRQPPSRIINRLRQTNQFTLKAIVASKRLEQTGPGRIISISGDVHHRNFTLGQEGKDLVLRLRTPVTGDNASEPEFIVPNVFTDNNFHQILLTFDGDRLQVYIDRPANQYSFAFKPEIIFPAYYPLPINYWAIDVANFAPLKYQLAFYSLIFLPFSFLAGLLLSLVKTRKPVKGLLPLVVLCILPALVIEGIQILLIPRSISIFNLILSIAILLVGTKIFHLLYSGDRPTSS